MLGATILTVLIAAPAPQMPTAILADRQVGAPDGPRYLREQVALLKGEAVLVPALRHPDVAQLAEVRKAPDPVVWLRESLLTEVREKQGYILIRVRASGRRSQAALANAVTDAYLRLLRYPDEAKISQFTGHREYYEKAIKRLRKKQRSLPDAWDPWPRDPGEAERAARSLEKAQRHLEDAIADHERSLRSIDQQLEGFRGRLRAPIRMYLLQRAVR